MVVCPPELAALIRGLRVVHAMVGKSVDVGKFARLRLGPNAYWRLKACIMYGYDELNKVLIRKP